MGIKMKIENMSDQAFGAGLAAAGGAGFTIQTLTEWANLAVTMGNLLLVAGGIYFMIHRFKVHIKNKRDMTRRASDKVGP